MFETLRGGGILVWGLLGGGAWALSLWLFSHSPTNNLPLLLHSPSLHLPPSLPPISTWTDLCAFFCWLEKCFTTFTSSTSILCRALFPHSPHSKNFLALLPPTPRTRVTACTHRLSTCTFFHLALPTAYPLPASDFSTCLHSLRHHLTLPIPLLLPFPPQALTCHHPTKLLHLWDRMGGWDSLCMAFRHSPPLGVSSFSGKTGGEQGEQVGRDSGDRMGQAGLGGSSEGQEGRNGG